MISDKDKQSGISDFTLFLRKTICPPPPLIQSREKTMVAAGRGVAISEFPITGLRNSESAVLNSPVNQRLGGFPVIQLMVPVIGRFSPREKNSPLPGMRTHTSTKAFPSRFSDCKLAP